MVSRSIFLISLYDILVNFGFDFDFTVSLWLTSINLNPWLLSYPAAVITSYYLPPSASFCSTFLTMGSGPFTLILVGLSSWESAIPMWVCNSSIFYNFWICFLCFRELFTAFLSLELSTFFAMGNILSMYLSCSWETTDPSVLRDWTCLTWKREWLSASYFWKFSLVLFGSWTEIS